MPAVAAVGRECVRVMGVYVVGVATAARCDPLP